MKLRGFWYAVNAVLALVILSYVVQTDAQTLQPVSSGLDLWPMLIGLVVIGVIVGLVIWHKRNPTAEAKALGEAHAAMTAVADKVVGLLAKEPAKPAPTGMMMSADGTMHILNADGTASKVPTEEQLANVEAARVAYENAKADAGIP